MNQQDLLASTQIIAFNPILAESDSVRTQYFAYLRTLVNRAKWNNRKYTKAQLIFYKEKLCNGRRNIHYRPEAAFAPRFSYLLPFDLAVMAGFNTKLLRSAKGTALLNKIASDFSLPKGAKRILSWAIDAALGSESAWKKVLQSEAMQDFGEYLQIVKGNSAFLRKQPFKILITATMSAGKSTLINALVGKNISLMQNLACTSKIHTIVAKSYEDGAISEDDHDLVLNASKEDLMTDNDSNMSSNITVGTYFGGFLGGERIVLLDSPGVNSSENKDHTEITQTMLRSKKYRMVLYVLNATQLGTTDEEAHLETVKQYIGRTKVIFVMNKIDNLVSEDDDLFSAIESQKKFLEKKGFRRPIICPVSARAAYLVKKSQQEPLSRLERHEMEKYMDKFEKLSLAAYYEEQLECTPITDCSSEEQALYRNCGFAYFEQLILALEKGEGLRVMSTRVSVDHDAQRQETAITVDGADLPKDSRLCQAASGRPLTEWADGFPELLCEELETEDFALEFCGTAPDWEALRDSFKRAQKNGIVKLAGLRYNKPRAEKNNRKSPATPQVSRSVPTLNVYLIATMSSGKTTLFNALLGQRLLPSKNEACTTTITEVRDNDADHFTATAYDANGQALPAIDPLTLSGMEELNNTPGLSKIAVEGNIPFVDSDKVALRLVDIPSSNFYNEASIKAAYRAISEIHLDENSMVLYVLNGTQLSTIDDTYMLRCLADKIKEGGEQAQDRVLFVVNKMDSFDPEEEDIGRAVNVAKNYLAKYGIEDPQIFPCSAFAALNLRTTLADVDIDHLSRAQLRKLPSAARDTLSMVDNLVDYYALHLEQYAPLVPEARQALNERLRTAERAGDTKTQALIHSGICSLEAAISAYVQSATSDEIGAKPQQETQEEPPAVQPDIEIQPDETEDEKMAQVYVKYNPYRLKTTIKVNGREVTQDSELYKLTEGKRLQEWIGKFPEKLRDTLNTMDFALEYYGMDLDWDDFQDAFVQAQKKGIVNIDSMNFIEGKSDEDINEKIVEIFKELQKGPVEDFRSPKLKKAFDSANNSVFPIHVIATMSSGKSTLINAMLGQKLMPSKNEACTATITEILDVDGEGFSAVVYDENGNVIERVDPLTYDEMNRLNEEAVHRISVRGDIPFVDSRSTALQLVDTPGPNNAQNQEHMNATYRAIGNGANNLILYVLNGTQLSTNDDASLLRYVSDKIKEGGKQARDRFLFVINKMDSFDPEEENIEKAVNAAKNYLAKYGIEDPQIFPCSAFAALNLRTTLADVDIDNLTRAQQKKLSSAARDTLSMVDKLVDYDAMHLEQYSTLSPSAQRRLNYRLSEAEDDTKEQALIHSGICSVEAAITAYVKKYAKTKKVKDLVETFQEVLTSNKVMAQAKEQVATSEEAARDCAERAAAVQQKIADGEEAAAFKARIAALDPMPTIEERAEQLKKEAADSVSQVFNHYGKIITSRDSAQRLVKTFSDYSAEAMARLTAELESTINTEIVGTSEGLLAEYQAKLEKMDESSAGGQLDFQTVDLIKGELQQMRENTQAWASDDFAAETVEAEGDTTYEERTYYEKVGQEEEEVVVGSHQEKIGTKKVWAGSHKEKVGTRQVRNPEKRWWKFFTPKYIDEDVYETVDDYKDEDVYETVMDYKTIMRDVFEERVERIEKFSVETKRIQRALMAKMRQSLDDGIKGAKGYAGEQVESIKAQFSDRFDELDKFILAKYDELDQAAKGAEQNQKTLEENRRKLAWLEACTQEINAVLDM